MGLSKSNATRFAFVSARSSAFCDEIVEVYSGDIEGDQGNRLCLVATGDTSAWIRADWLEPPPRPIRSPYPKTETRRIYQAMLGRAPPDSASPGQLWATVSRYLVKADWSDFQAWWEGLYPHARAARQVIRPKAKGRSARSTLPLHALGWMDGPAHGCSRSRLRKSTEHVVVALTKARARPERIRASR